MSSKDSMPKGLRRHEFVSEIIDKKETEADTTVESVDVPPNPALLVRLMAIDATQAKRYAKLTGVAHDIASEGIMRHLSACDRTNIPPDQFALREIIDSAKKNRKYADSSGE